MRSQAASSEVQEALKAGLTEMAGAHSALAKARSARGRPARPGGSTARSVEEERVGRLPAARRRAHGEAAKIIDLGNGDYVGPRNEEEEEEERCRFQVRYEAVRCRCAPWGEGWAFTCALCTTQGVLCRTCPRTQGHIGAPMSFLTF